VKCIGQTDYVIP